jgi:hypothetical protein
VACSYTDELAQARVHRTRLGSGGMLQKGPGFGLQYAQ